MRLAEDLRIVLTCAQVTAKSHRLLRTDRNPNRMTPYLAIVILVYHTTPAEFPNHGRFTQAGRPRGRDAMRISRLFSIANTLVRKSSSRNLRGQRCNHEDGSKVPESRSKSCFESVSFIFFLHMPWNLVFGGDLQVTTKGRTTLKLKLEQSKHSGGAIKKRFYAPFPRI